MFHLFSLFKCASQPSVRGRRNSDKAIPCSEFLPVAPHITVYNLHCLTDRLPAQSDWFTLEGCTQSGEWSKWEFLSTTALRTILTALTMLPSNSPSHMVRSTVSSVVPDTHPINFILLHFVTTMSVCVCVYYTYIHTCIRSKLCEDTF